MSDHTDPEWFQQAYQEEQSLSGVANRAGVSLSTAHYWAEKHGIERRPRGGVRKEYARLTVDKDGYPVWWGRHTYSERMLVHRLAAVAWFGYEPVAESDVHHQNSVPWDNREANLEVLGHGEHARLHGLERRDEQAEIGKRVAERHQRDADGRFAGER